MFNPLYGPMMWASASTIAMRMWLMVPAGGRSSPWQRREASRMVTEKVAAVQESQARAAAMMWRMWFSPWTLWTDAASPRSRRAAERAAVQLTAPFARRAAANARRLRTRAIDPRHAVVPLIEAGRVAASWPRSNVIPLRPVSPSRRRGG